jgi:histidinol-phosphate aminotransferase
MEALAGGSRSSASTRYPDDHGAIRLSSNENPNGPAREALDALTQALHDANRYPEGYLAQLLSAIASHFGVSADNVVVGCGSGEILRMAVEAYTLPTRALVTASPTFEAPERFAQVLGHPVRAVPVDQDLRLDLEAMAKAAEGAGLVYLCNPNNPTATAHPLSAVRNFVAAVRRTSPDTTILIDEAYFEFADLAGYGTMIPDAMNEPYIIVTRTFSKVYGLAGLRVGYMIAQTSTAARMEPYRLGAGLGVLAASAAQASLPLTDHVAEQARLNRETRAFTRQAFEKLGFHVVPSDTNFMMIDVRRDAADFQRACKQRGVLIGRVFPPLLTHARISVGTMDEMRRAMDAIGPILQGA